MFRSLRFPCLLVAALALTAGPAAALPLHVTGFGDSLTVPGNDGRYLDHLNDFLDPDVSLSSVGFAGRSSGGVRTLLQGWLSGGNSADLGIVLSGTPDVFATGYSEATTVANIAGMLGDLAAAGIPAILMAPPRVFDPCDGAAPAGFCPDTLNTRLLGLSGALATVASGLGVPFLDLFALFDAQADTQSLYLVDGVHWRFLGGDLLVAQHVAPLVAAALPEPGLLALLGAALLLAAAWRLRAE